MNDSHEDRTDPSTPRAGTTDEVIQAFIDRIRNDGSRRHYLSVRRPRDSQGETDAVRRNRAQSTPTTE